MSMKPWNFEDREIGQRVYDLICSSGNVSEEEPSSPTIWSDLREMVDWVELGARVIVSVVSGLVLGLWWLVGWLFG